MFVAIMAAILTFILRIVGHRNLPVPVSTYKRTMHQFLEEDAVDKEKTPLNRGASIFDHKEMRSFSSRMRYRLTAAMP
jgi:hypothetical protein